MSLFDVKHQPKGQRLVQRALASDRLPHAYIFDGPEGVGRETFAVRLAKILLCEQPLHLPAAAIEGFESWSGPVRDACQACDSCLALRTDSHPDLHLIYRELIKQHPDSQVRARKGIDLGIDVIREFVIDRVANKPVLGRAKVFVVRQADSMNTAAQNALLKTLEEPPPTTFLILVVSSLDALLPTVRSRCQVIPFGPLPADFIVNQLLSKTEAMTEKEALLCATYATGSLGLAWRYHQDRMSEYHLRLHELFADQPLADVTALAKGIIANAKNLGSAYQQRDREISETQAQRLGLKSLLGLLSIGYREVLHAAVGSGVGSAETSTGAKLVKHSKSLSPVRVVKAISYIAAAEQQLDLNVNVQLCLEALLVRLSRLHHP